MRFLLPLLVPLARRTRAPAVQLSTSVRSWQKRQAPLAFDELNARAFDGALPPVPLSWAPRLRRTAGRCHFLQRGDARAAAIELSPRVLDTPSRLRATLAHEMCHAAQWLLDGEARPPHGDAFWRWARRVEEAVPEVRISTHHTYAIFCRHQYSCTDCGQAYGRHSRSLDLRNRRCGRCRGALQYDGTAQPNGAPATPARAKLPPFAAFVATEYAPLRRRWPRVSHQRIMQELGRKWRRRAGQAQARARPARARQKRGV
jgi:predicted SprT family Zn-dependent metalloprotease